MFLAVIRRFPLLRVVNFWPGDDFLGSSSAKTSIFPRNFLERKSCRDPHLSIRLSRRMYTGQHTARARRTMLRPPRRPSWRFAARVTVAMLQAGMLFQFGFDCCLVRYLLAALLERDGFVLVLRSRESFCVSLLLPHTCCVCRVCVHPGHRY